jgi:hypothetical protein
MSDRLILIKGLNSFFVSGPGQWDFLMDVASSTKSGESCRANKTNVDGLRNALKKQYGDGLGKAILKRLITFDRGCGYRLGDTVKRSNSSQIAIKRTIRKADPFEPYEGD